MSVYNNVTQLVESQNQADKLSVSNNHSSLFENTSGRNKRLNVLTRPYLLLSRNKHSGVKPQIGKLNRSECYKVSQMKTDLSKLRYKFPAKEDEAKYENMCTKDPRNILEVFRDIIGIMLEQYTEEDIKFMSLAVGYDVSIPQYSESGVPMTQTLLNTLIREFKAMNGIHKVGRGLEEYWDKKTGRKARHWLPPPIDKKEKRDIANEHLVACVNFIGEKDFVLDTHRKKQSFYKFKNKIKYKKNIGRGRLQSFFKDMEGLYYDPETDKWDAPNPSPITHPTFCFYTEASGKPLYFVQAHVVNNNNNLAPFVALLDSGATHDLLPCSYILKENIKIKKFNKSKKIRMFTAGSEVKDCVEGSVTLRVWLKGKESDYWTDVNFLVVNDNMSISKPIFGLPFHEEKKVHIQYEDERGKNALFKTENGDNVRVFLPRAAGDPQLVTCNAVDATDGDQVENLPDESVEVLSIQAIDQLERAAEKQLVTTCLLIYGDTKAETVLTNLGGDSSEIDLPLEDELDQHVFDQLDLLRILDIHATKKEFTEVLDKSVDKKYIDEINKLMIKYEDAFASENRKLGCYRYSFYVPDVIEGKTAKQANRNVDPTRYPSAMKKIDELIKLGVIKKSIDASTTFVHNLLLQHKRKSDEAGRKFTKADAHIQGAKAPLNDPNASIRVINDLTSFNECLADIPSIQLPSEAAVKTFVKHKMVSLIDLKDMFYSIRIKPEAYKYFNFYLLNEIYTLTRLAQGCGASPYVAVQALRNTFSKEVWESFKSQYVNRFKYLFRFYDSYDDLQISFVDDVIIATYALCKCPGFMCMKGFHCKTYDVNSSAILHIEAFECILFAIQNAGFLIAPNKCEIFTQHSFVFLGVHYDSTTNKYGIALDRAKSILSFRIPKSIPELGSRLSSLFYSAPHVPLLRKIALPLTRVVYQNHFVWTQRELQCWNNCKLLVSLCIGLNHLFEPNRHTILVSDSSKEIKSYVLYQLTESGLMIVVNNDGLMWSGAESRYVAVYRELKCLTWAIEQNEKYILACTKKVLVLGDAQSVLFLKQCKNWQGSLADIQVYFSKFPNIIVSFLPGRFISLPDDFSRQFSDVYVNTTDAPLSRIMSEVVAPMPKSVLNKVHKMTGAELTDYLYNENMKIGKIDIWDKSRFVKQNYRSFEFANLLREVQPLNVLLKYLKDPYNLKHLDTQTTKEFFSVLAGSTKTKIENWIKDMKLDHLQKALKDIDIESSWRTVFGADRNKSPLSGAQTNAVTAVTTRSAHRKNNSESITHKSANKKYASCVTEKTIHINLKNELYKCHHYEQAKDKIDVSLEQMQQFCENLEFWNEYIPSFEPLAKPLPDAIRDKILNKINTFNNNNCLIVRYLLSRDICILLSTSNPINSGLENKAKTRIFAYMYKSENWRLKEEKGNLYICLEEDVTLEGLEYIRFTGHFAVLQNEAYLEQHWPLDSTVKVYCDIIELDLIYGQNIALQNMDIQSVTIKKHTKLFKITPKQSDLENWFVRMQPIPATELLESYTSLINKQNCDRYEMCLADYFAHANSIILSPAVTSLHSPLPEIDDDTIESVCATIAGGKVNVIKMRQQFLNKNNKSTKYHGQFHLSALLFGHRMRQKRGILRRDDLKALQNSDTHLQQKIDKLKCEIDHCNINDDADTVTPLFFLEDEILYRNTELKRFQTMFQSICLPRFLIRSVLANLHLVQSIHMNDQQMYTLLRTHIYAYDMYGDIKRAREKCTICMYAHQTTKQKLHKDNLMWRQHKMAPGRIAQTDLVFLPHSVYSNSSVVLTYVDCLTKFFTAIPLSNKTEGQVVKGFEQIFSLIPTPQVICADSGSEFISQRVRDFLGSFDIDIHYGVTKDSQSLIENANKHFKALLNFCMQKHSVNPSNWSEYRVQALQLYNNRPPGKNSLFSRFQLFYSPLHYISPRYLSVAFDEDSPISKLHQTHLWQLFEPYIRLKPRKGVKDAHLTKGKIVAHEVTRYDQKSHPKGNKQLLPSTDKILRVDSSYKGSQAIGKDLLTGKRVRITGSEVKPIGPADFEIPNPFVKLRHINDIVKPINNVEHAKLWDRAENPQMFAVSGQTIKSILKRKDQVFVQPAKNGVGIEHLLRAYEKAANLSRELHNVHIGVPSFMENGNELTAIKQVRVPEWFTNLESQRPGHGSNQNSTEVVNYSPVIPADRVTRVQFRLAEKCSKDKCVGWSRGHGGADNAKDKDTIKLLTILGFKCYQCAELSLEEITKKDD